MSHAVVSSKKVRKTLVERVSECTVKDPSEHAKRQVSELDKTAKASQLKRKLARESIDNNTKELVKLDEQIRSIKLNYDPLCTQLQENKEKKEHLMKVLAQCTAQEHQIMGTVKETVIARRIDDNKLTKKLVTVKLAMERGFDTTDVNSTFKQHK